MQRIISSQCEGFPWCCVSRLWLKWLFVVFQTISSCPPPTPSHAHFSHLVCNAALAICTCLDSNYGVVKAFLPVACKFLLSHTLKSTESHLNGVHVFLLFHSVVVVINLFAKPYALHINKINRLSDCNANTCFVFRDRGTICQQQQAHRERKREKKTKSPDRGIPF